MIEQVNDQAKLATRFFHGVVPITQLGLATQLLRVGYLFQNFKPAFIQNQISKSKQRPSRGEIRWFGATDKGLINICPNVELWGTVAEIELHADLSKQYPSKTPTEISEMVLERDIPTKLKAELEALS